MNIKIALVFEESPDAEGRKCLYCRKIIDGKKFQAVLQVELNMKAFDLFICEKCFQKSDQFSHELPEI